MWRSGRSHRVLLTVLQGVMAAASSTLSPSSDRDSLGSYSSFKLAQPLGRRICGGEGCLFLTNLCTVSGYLLWSKKRGTQSWLVCVTWLSPGLGFRLALKQRKEKDHFFFLPRRIMMSGSKRCPGSHSCSSGALTLQMLTMQLQVNDAILIPV